VNLCLVGLILLSPVDDQYYFFAFIFFILDFAVVTKVAWSALPA
jgi:hypothetical protein